MERRMKRDYLSERGFWLLEGLGQHDVTLPFGAAQPLERRTHDCGEGKDKGFGSTLTRNGQSVKCRRETSFFSLRGGTSMTVYFEDTLNEGRRTVATRQNTTSKGVQKSRCQHLFFWPPNYS